MADASETTHPIHDPQSRREAFDAFYALTASQIMDRRMDKTLFVALHTPIDKAVELLLDHDHAWVAEDLDAPRRVISILLREDLLSGLEPTQRSYSRFSRLRYKSLAHGSAECTCRFCEGRVLHTVAPDTSCLDLTHTMVSKSATYLPVMENGEMVGEIGQQHLIAALHRQFDLNPSTAETPSETPD